jgi:hypothetical protein
MPIPDRRRGVNLSGNAADGVVPGGRSASGTYIRGRFLLIGRQLATGICRTDKRAVMMNRRHWHNAHLERSHVRMAIVRC